jgi:hypothetical protein
MPNKKMKYCYCSLECKERRRLLSYRQRLRHYKKAKLANISPSVSPTESSVDSQATDLESEIGVSGGHSDVSMGEPEEGPSPNHSEQSESDEDAVSNHANENVQYDEEEENNNVVDELDMVGGPVDAEVEALHHSLRKFTCYWKVFK